MCVYLFPNTINSICNNSSSVGAIDIGDVCARDNSYSSGLDMTPPGNHAFLLIPTRTPAEGDRFESRHFFFFFPTYSRKAQIMCE